MSYREQISKILDDHPEHNRADEHVHVLDLIMDVVEDAEREAVQEYRFG